MPAFVHSLWKGAGMMSTSNTRGLETQTFHSLWLNGRCVQLQNGQSPSENSTEWELALERAAAASWVESEQ